MWRVEQMTHRVPRPPPPPPPHESPVQQITKCLRRFVLVFLPGAPPDVSLWPVCFLSRTRASGGGCDVMRASQRLNISPSQSDSPGVWRLEVICHGDQAGQLGDATIKADRPSFPPAILSIWISTQTFFFYLFFCLLSLLFPFSCAHGTA